MEPMKLLQQALRQLQCIFLLPSPKEAACFQLYAFGTRILIEAGRGDGRALEASVISDVSTIVMLKNVPSALLTVCFYKCS